MNNLPSSYSILLGFLCLALYFADTIDGRKDPGEYWHEVMQEEPMPELIQTLISKSSSSSPTWHHPDDHGHHNLQASSFEPRTFVSSSGGHDHNSTPQVKKSYEKEFEPRPNVSFYNNDSKLATERGFEPRPNVSAYTDDNTGLKEEDKDLQTDFEPRPNVSAYGDDAIKQENNEKSLAKSEFEPRPNVSAYTEDVRQQKSFDKEFEPRPNVNTYEE